MNKKLIFLILGGIIVIGLIIYFIFIYRFNGPETTPDGQTTPTPGQIAAPVITESPAAPSTASRTPEEQSRDQASQLAASFAERYGSSSSQSAFGNLRDLEVFMTDALAARTEAYIAEENAKAGAAAYQGTITKAVVADITAFDAAAGTASITVKTKRQETNTSGETRNFDQDLKLGLRKVNGEWKVDSAAWSE